MIDRQNYFDQLKSLNKNDFEKFALNVFRFQSLQNKIYSEFTQSLHIVPEKINTIQEIPFLPVEFFRSHRILTGHEKYKQIFTSSGTANEDRKSVV